MSSSYIISPPAANSGLRVDPAYLAEQIKLKWPRVRAEILSDPHQSYVLTWQLNPEPFSLAGGLQNNREAISFESVDGLHVAEFAIWYRHIIPPQYKLIFFISSMNKPPVDLDAETNAQQILSAL